MYQSRLPDMLKTNNPLTKNMFLKFFLLSLTPMIFINNLSFIVAIIWLLFLKKWQLIAIGFFLLLIHNIILSVFMLPTILTSFFIKSIEKKKL